MTFPRILGFLLLITGLVVIALSIFTSFMIFTGKIDAPNVIKIQSIVNVQVQQSGQNPVNSSDIQKELQKMIDQGIKDLVPAEIISRILNLMIFALFASFMIFAGAQIAGLGVKLMRT